MAERNGRGWRSRLGEGLRNGPGYAGPSGVALTRAERVTLCLLGALFVSAALAVLDYGAPPLGFREEEKVRSDFQARVDFEYDDPAAYNEMRSQAASSTPEIYLQEPRWAEGIRADVEKLVEVKTKAKDLEEFRKSVADLKLVTDPKAVEPLWSALESLTNLQEDLVVPIAAALAPMEEVGVLDNERWKLESGPGRPGRIERRAKAKAEVPGKDFGYVAYAYSEDRARRELGAVLNLVLKSRPKALAETVRPLVLGRVRPSLVYDRALSEAAQKAAEAAVDPKFAKRERKKGDILMRAGDVIGEPELLKLRAENRAWWEAVSPAEHLLRTGGLLIIVSVLFGAAFAWVARSSPEVLRHPRRLALLGLLGAAVLLAARAVGERDWPFQAVPVVFFGMVAALVFSARPAAILAVLLSALSAPALGGSSFYGAAALAAGASAGALAGARPRHHLDVLKAALVAGLIMAAAAAAGQVLAGSAEAWTVVHQAGWGLGAALVQGLVLAGALPLLEAAFGTTTSIRLREICDPNQSAVLKALFLNAPGSYQHSMVVGMLSENAAAAIGVDPLLARAGGYYHDIGKMARPEYFVENAPPGENRHDRLRPAMSAMVVIAHVRDGTELAREYRLPREVVQIIEQHHGTTLAEFFYRRAVERGEEPAESVYRYGGPRPQSPEAAIVLLADAVEAASRTLQEPSVARIEAMVRELARRRLLEGQFDECGLNLRELAVVETTFARILISMFHARVAYQKDAAQAPEAGE